MNEDLRQRMIDSVNEDDDLLPQEKETTIRMARDQTEITVFSAEGSVSKRLLAHPEFEIDHIRQKTSDSKVDIDAEDLAEEFDGRRRTVAVQGTMPVGVLTIKSSSRQSTGHAPVVSGRASDLRLSQLEND